VNDDDGSGARERGQRAGGAAGKIKDKAEEAGCRVSDQVRHAVLDSIRADGRHPAYGCRHLVARS
jgi:hypothetical protein